MGLRMLLSAVLLVGVAAPAHAGIKELFRRGPRAPKPISLTADRVDRGGGERLVLHHPPLRYSGGGWGSRADLLRKHPSRPLSPALKRRQY